MTTSRIYSVRAHVFRAPLENPLPMSFGRLTDRPAVFVAVQDEDGATGWGEVFSNWPTVGAEHRGRLVNEVIGPALVGQEVTDPSTAFDRLTAGSAVLALQADEPGPFAQCIAGIDVALWDLLARRADMPLCRYLGGSADRVATYASGLSPEGAVKIAEAKRKAGYRAFKLKVGFGDEVDIAALGALRTALGDQVQLYVDANQAWDAQTTIRMSRLLAKARPDWLEEPLRADAPAEAWQHAASESALPFAGGENMRSDADFETAIHSGCFRVLQPDIIKWGGISRIRLIAPRILEAGLSYYPHYLGGAIGLMASAHLLAAVGGGGQLEIDANPNPLREFDDMPALDNSGMLPLPDRAGLGLEPDLARLEPLRTL